MGNKPSAESNKGIHLLLQHQVQAQKNKRDLLDLDQSITRRILCFLDVSSINNLRLCNLRLLSTIDICQNGYGLNCIIENTQLPPTLVNQLSLNIQGRWVDLLRNKTRLNKYNQLLNFQQLSVDHFLTVLPEDLSMLAQTKFQVRAIQQSLRITKSTNIQIDQNLCLNNSDIDQILLSRFHSLQEKHQILNSLWMQQKCLFYNQLIKELLQIQEPLVVLRSFNQFWEEYLQFQYDFEIQPKRVVFDHQTYELYTQSDYMIMNWNEFVMTEEISVSLVSMFTSILENERAMHATAGVDLQSEVIKVLRKTFQAFVDLSCHSEQVRFMGQSEFKGTHYYNNCLQTCNSDSANFHNFSILDLDKVTEIYQKDLELLLYIFGADLVQNFFQPEHFKRQKMLVKDFLVAEHKRLNLIKMSDLEENPTELTSSEVLTQSSVAEFIMSSFDFKQKLIDETIRESVDLLEQLVSQIIVEDKTQYSSNQSINSSQNTNASTAFSGSALLESNKKVDSQLTARISSYIKRSYPVIDDTINHLQRQEATRCYEEQQRARFLRRSFTIFNSDNNSFTF